MSTFTHESFGDIPGCVGSDPESFKNCIIELHSNERKWVKVRNEGIAYIEETHNRQKTMEVWSNVIGKNYHEQEVGNHKLLNGTVEHDEAAHTVLEKVLTQSLSPLEQWKNSVCDFTAPDSICHEVFVVEDINVTFCSAAKVASTTIKTYFFKITNSSIVIPENAKYGVHEANWTRFHMLNKDTRVKVLTSPDWTNVFFYKNVLERFISGYLDKVVKECKKFNTTNAKRLAIGHYVQYGFSCEKHNDLEEFVSFMETVPQFEGHFHSQTPLCGVGRYPFTHIIQVNDTLTNSLEDLSVELGVEHPVEDKRSRGHSTGARDKLIGLLKDKLYLIPRILDLFKEDCKAIPNSCFVDDIIEAVKEDTTTM